MALYSKEIKRAQDKAKSGKSTKITGDPRKWESVGSTYEAAQKVSQPKKKVVKKKETVTTTKSLPPKKRTKKPFGLGPDDKAYGALPKKKRTKKPVGFSAEAVRQGKKQRDRLKKTVDVTKLPPKKRTAQPFGPGTKDVKRSSTLRKGEPKVTKKRLSDPSYNPMGIKGSRLARDKRKDAKRSKETEVMRLKAAEYGKPDVLYDKTGGKVSRKKGGTVSRNTGGWLGGNSEVSKWYD
jgi:hypothetical protein